MFTTVVLLYHLRICIFTPAALLLCRWLYRYYYWYVYHSSILWYCWSFIYHRTTAVIYVLVTSLPDLTWWLDFEISPRTCLKLQPARNIGFPVDYIVLLWTRPIFVASWVILFFLGIISFGCPLDFPWIIVWSCPRNSYFSYRKNRKRNRYDQLLLLLSWAWNISITYRICTSRCME